MAKSWYVFNMDNGGEISVNYGNIKKHHTSYGWADMDKIIIGDNESNYNKVKKLKIATLICETLNNNNIKV